MKSLLSAVIIVAALSVVGIAATPDEDAPAGTENLKQVSDDVRYFEPGAIPQDVPAQDRELREQYLTILEESVRDMPTAELERAIRDAQARVRWRRAKDKLQEAADILAVIYVNYRETAEAQAAQQILENLMEHGIRSRRLRLDTNSHSLREP